MEWCGLQKPGLCRRVWPCLVKPAQRYIACFETLAQLALLQATHSHIGGGRYSFSMPSGTDNSAAEAGINKLFTTSWPLQVFVQLVASWAHANNVLLQPTHLPGRYNDWADDLSRNRLARFAHRPANRPQRHHGAQNICLQPPGMCDIWLASHPASESQYGLRQHRALAFCISHCEAFPPPEHLADSRVCAQTPSIRKRTDESRCIEGSAMPSHCLSLCFVPPQVQPLSEGGTFAPGP